MGQKFNTPIFLFLVAFLCFQHTIKAQIFSNEIHYDNSGIDLNEKIEVAGPTGTNLSGWSIILYNAVGGVPYHTIDLSGTIPPGCVVNGQAIGALAFGPNLALSAIQNGAPDGWALVNGTTVVELLSYEGTFMATSGPATGMTSTDIGAFEDGQGTANSSIQRTGATTWVTNSAANTMNACNTTQYVPVTCVAPTFTACPSSTINANTSAGQCSATVTYTVTATGTPAPTLTYTFSGATTGSGSGTGSGSVFNTGNTTVTVTATNTCGAPTCTFTVSVTDNEVPTITCPLNIIINNTPGQCNATAVYTSPVGTDNCSGATTARTTGLASGATYPVGVTTNTFVVTASNGQTASCSFTVTVNDNQAPTIICPANVAVNNDLNQCSAVVSFTPPTGSDNCPSVITIQTTGLASGAAFPVGVTTNTFRATAANGQTATCSFTVTVNDNQLPTISCPGAIAVNNDVNMCSAVVSYTAPAGTDNCSGATTARTGGLNSGATYPVGTTTNTFTVTASNGQSASCTFTVTVTDNQVPSITCPGAIAVNNDVNMCSAVVNYTTPSGTDNCSGATTAQTTGLASGAVFPVGVTTNTFVVTASNGQTASCTFTVTVTDNQAPMITCPGAVAVNNDMNMCSAVVNYTAPTGTDNCSGATTAQTTGLASGAAFPVGVTTNTFVVTASNGQTASCTFTVTVTDNQAPTISCPGAIAVNSDMNMCSAVVPYNTPSGTDNCSGATTAQTTGLASGAAFPVGVTTNTFVVTASNGQTASCTFTVTVTDTEAPSISCPGAIAVNNDVNMCSAVVNYSTPSGTSLCGGISTSQTTGLASGAAFPVGVTTNTFVATASNGQTASCTFTVTVTDNVAPAITCPDAVAVNNDMNMCSAVVNYTAPTGTDNCSGANTGQTTGLASGAAFPVGVTTNTFVVTASNGQTASCTFTVTVTDNQVPMITCPGAIAVNNDVNMCSAVVPYNTPTGTDNCSGATTAQTTGLASGAAFPVGVTTNTFVVTASNGQTASCTFTVTVTDNQAPMISCPGAIAVNNDVNMCSAVVTFTAPSGTSLCGGVSTSQTTGLGSGAAFPVGVTTNTFVATASNGQTASCTFTVTVTDNEVPSINCPGAIAVNNDMNMCSAVVPYNTPTGTDNCSGATTAQTTGLASGAAFPAGVTTNTFVVTASNGQTASCTFTVTVTDNQAPTISCPGAVAVNNDNNQCSAVVTYTAPTGTDNCLAPITSQTTGLASGAAFPAGVTTNTFVVTASNGQTASCTFTVTVTDNQVPSISCPGAIAVNNDVNMCSAVVPYNTPAGTDNCSGATTAQTTGLASGEAFSVGVTTNTFVVTAANGQTASCTFTVTVTDNEAPSISCPGAVAVSNDLNMCSAVVNYTAPSGMDNCSGATTAQTTGLASGAAFPVGVTTNTFVVTASNGQTASCTFTVTVTDNEAPSITCPGAVATAPDPGECFATSVVLGSAVTNDNCGVMGTVNNGTSSYNVGMNNVTYTVTDIHGNTNTCIQTVTVDPCNYDISGNILWEHNNAAVKDVTVQLQNLPGLSSAGSMVTGVPGTYSFSVTPGGSYRVRPSKNLNLLNGVDASDATRIQQHITNNPPLAGAYKRIAADVNKSNTITTYDATLITQALAGNAAALLVFNTSWRFVPAAHTFTNPNAPWGFPEKIDLMNISANASNQNFIGIKLGDVNGTGNPLLRPGRPVVVQANDQITEQGKSVDITFTADAFEDIAAFQFALGFDPEILAFESVRSEGTLDMTSDNFGTSNAENGEFRAVWSVAQGRYLPQGTKLFTIRAKALQSGFKISELLYLNDKALQGGAWNTALGETAVELSFLETQVSGTTGLPGDADRLQLLQNRPNPFTGTTTIGFTLPQSCEAKLRVVDMNGRLITESGKFYPAGYHQEVIDLSGRTGLFYYELVTPMGVLAKKMSVTEK